MLQVAAQTRQNVRFGIGRACISARLNDERIYVAADTAKECKDHAAALMHLARRHGLSMLKINNLLYASALASIDTAPVDLEEDRFEFPLCEPWELGPVPDPSENVDVIEASNACAHDARVCAKMLEERPTLRQLFEISANQRAWMEYFVVRDADPNRRRTLADALAEHLRLADQNTERLQEIVRRRIANGHKAN